MAQPPTIYIHLDLNTKTTQIESRANVFEIRGNHLVVRQRHHRNVVSALGHFLSLVVSMTHLVLWIPPFYLLSDSEELYVKIRNVNMFLIPSFNFCVHTLVETVFSDVLWDSFVGFRWAQCF